MRNLFRRAFFADRSSNCQWLKGAGFKPGSSRNVALAQPCQDQQRGGSWVQVRHSGSLEGSENRQTIIRGDYCRPQGSEALHLPTRFILERFTACLGVLLRVLCRGYQGLSGLLLYNAAFSRVHQSACTSRDHLRSTKCD